MDLTSYVVAIVDNLLVLEHRPLRGPDATFCLVIATTLDVDLAGLAQAAREHTQDCLLLH